MDVEPRVQLLLEDMLDSGQTPEEVCRDCPELLSLVLKEWRRKLACDAELDALFACSEPDAPSGDLSSESPSSELPRIPGHELEGVLLNCQERIVNRNEEFDAEPRPLCLVPV